MVAYRKPVNDSVFGAFFIEMPQLSAPHRGIDRLLEFAPHVPPIMPFSSLGAGLFAIGALLALGGDGTGLAARPNPALVLWSWDRADDLRFIDARDTGVAFLAATVHVTPSGVIVTPRRNPLQLPPQTTRIAVAHIALDRDAVPGPADRAAVVDALAAIGAKYPGAALQIDFEVPASQRGFLIGVVEAARRRLPDMHLSITALTSWCLNKTWVAQLPVDEIVPMLFRLGPDRDRIRASLVDGGDFRDPRCRASLGVSTDEMPAALPTDRRLYAFTPQRWTAARYAVLRRKIFR